jgi:transposase
MLRPQPIEAIPADTARIARAAFRKGTTVMRLRDAFGTLFNDEDFAALFPATGQPALAPWRLALVAIFQFLENLTDRQAADAVRGRVDWKYALSLELEDPGFDFSVLSEFRDRLIAGGSEQLLLDKLLEHFKARGLIKERGKQRTDSTFVLANIRVMNRTELVGETLRAALNEIAEVDPDWLRASVPAVWFERYSHRVEEYRLPKSKAARDTYLLTVGEDGFALLDAVNQAASEKLKELGKVKTLQAVWDRHYERKGKRVRWRESQELSRAASSIESPYDPEARYSTKRGKEWIGYKVHLTESCDDDSPHLIVSVLTTPATQQDVSTTLSVHQVLANKHHLPGEHLVDAGYIDADLLVEMNRDYDVQLVGPPRGVKGWQTKEVGAFAADNFEIDWRQEQVSCPASKTSTYWKAYQRGGRYPRDLIKVRFATADCRGCPLRARCTRSPLQPRSLHLQPKAAYEALKAARQHITSAEGQKAYQLRAGIESTLSQGTRAFGMRHSRYRGQAKTHFQETAAAAAINVVRATDWLIGLRPKTTRPSLFARLNQAA